MDKKLEKMKFEQLTNLAAEKIFMALLEEGGKGFRSAVYVWLSAAVDWGQIQKRK